MTKAQTIAHKRGNAVRRSRIAIAAKYGPKRERAYWAASIGVIQAGKFSTTRNFCPAKAKGTK